MAVVGMVMCLHAFAITVMLAAVYVNPDVPGWYWVLVGLNVASMAGNGFAAWVRVRR